MSLLAQVFGWMAVAVLGVMTFAFAHDTKGGLWTAAHRLDRLPAVMATRYVALAVLGAGILIVGSLPLLALFFAVAAGLGLADALIYWRAGGTVWPHAAAAALGTVAAAVTLAAMVLAEAGAIGTATGAATGTLGD